MKIVRFKKDSITQYGILEGTAIRELKAEIFNPLEKSPYSKSARSIFTGQEFSLEEVKLLAPCQPTKIAAVGLNYRSHAHEVQMELPKEPLLFLKPSTAVIGPDDHIVFPSMSRRIDYEAELGVVIGTEAKDVSQDEAKKYILGYTCFNDVTARDLQGRDKQFTRSKSFDTFAPMGPWIETELDPTHVKVESYLEGKLKQSGTTADMLFSVFQLVAFISRVMTLFPGDVIATGTPAGIGAMRVGETIEVIIEGIGTLRNYVAQPKSQGV
jgi:2-keto-4-pentenoate hydratase/2-oxohepta-3-ene-1,7-dioic acid hydratase in catechol pathway